MLIAGLIPDRHILGMSNLEGQIHSKLTTSQKNELAARIVKNSLNMELVLWQFRKMHLVKRGLKPYAYKNKRTNEEFTAISIDKHWSFYNTMDQQNYNKLIKTFRTLYPDLYEELKKTIF
jgi:acyl carrier protein phosphodiesterase